MNSDWNLMGINKRYAVFSMCKENINVFNHKVGPFLYINQFNYCTHLIRVPLISFIRLGEQVEDLPTKCKFVLLSNVGRCGSTLLTQLFEEMPNSVAISEPEVLMEFSHEKTFDSFSDQQRYILLEACIRFLFRSAKQSKATNVIENFLIKPKAHGVSIAKELCNLYPNINHLYMYRHPAEYVRSIRSLYHSLFPAFVYKLLSIPTFYKWITSDSFGMNMKEFVLRHIDPRCKDDEGNLYRLKIKGALDKFDVEEERHLEQRFAAMYCANLLSILDIVSDGHGIIHVVSYHELKNDTESCMDRIYKFCDIKIPVANKKHSNVSKVRCLPEGDSQANSAISRRNLKSYQNILNEKDIMTVNDVLKYSGIPCCENFPLESDKFVACFNVLKSQNTSRQPCSFDSQTSHLSNEFEISKKLLVKDVSRNRYESQNKEIQSIHASNKSIWLPINRFF